MAQNHHHPQPEWPDSPYEASSPPPRRKMSQEVTKIEHDDAQDSSLLAESEPKLRYKSYRKKYRKMRLRFDDKMEEANQLFIAEHKAWDIAKRIQEQNDQLLDLLVDINENVAPANKKFDLGSPKAKNKQLTQIVNGDSSKGPNPELSLAALEARVAYTLTSLPEEDELPNDLKDGTDGSAPPAYLTAEHETKYLAAIDKSLSHVPSTANLPVGVETIQPEVRPREKTLLTERDFAVDCPVSVYNWLRKFHPAMYEQIKDKDSDRGELVPTSKPGPKKRKGKQPVLEDEPLDPLDEELGVDSVFEVPMVGPHASRSKRKTDDPAFRPKGGRSRPAKKRKKDAESGDTPDGRAGKKQKTALHGEDGA